MASRSTVVPFFVALGITLIFLGLVSSDEIAATGLLVFVAALIRWILDISAPSKDHAH